MASIDRVALSGADGFVGSRLAEVLQREGIEVWPLVRTKSRKAREIFYDYHQKKIDRDKLAECDAVIHLAGKNLFSSVWTPGVKKELYNSRVQSTRFIAHTLAELKKGPKILLNASAVGIYGNRGAEKLDEDSHAGHGFLAELCIDWERGLLFAQKAGVRTVSMRFGIVLGREGGMLKALETPFKLGLGAQIGDGNEFFSYVTREELVRQIIFLLNTSSIAGPVNMVSYEPTTNKEFTQALGTVLNRPAFLRVPMFMLKLLGDMSQMFTASMRVYPKVLLDHGFVFDEHHHISQVLEGLYQQALK